MKTTKCSTALTAGLVATLIAWTSFAGVAADLTVKEFKTDKKGRKIEHVATGKYYSDAKKVMVEHQFKLEPITKPKAKKGGKTDAVESAEAPKQREPVKQTIIVDNTTNKMIRLAHPKKQFVEFDLNMPRTWENGFWMQAMQIGAIPANEQEFQKHQYELKAVKVEKLNGHPCQVWQATRAGKVTKEVVEIWEAKDLDNVPLKLVVKEDGRKVREMTLTNAKKTEVAVATFAPPADYTKHEIKVMTGGIPPEMQKKMGQQKGPQAQKPRKL